MHSSHPQLRLRLARHSARMPSRRRPRSSSLLAIGLAGLALIAGAAPAADAATSRATSSNWAGYAVTKSGTRFRHVGGTWVQPAVDCAAGSATYSSVWVGLGGYAQTSRALEQIGTEADCSAPGQATYSAWYEVVPDISHSARITIRPGDELHASAAVAGHTVTLSIKNLTRGTAFTKVLRAAAVDTRSAEWIVEAPSLCTNAGDCATTPLAAFTTTTFRAARAVSSTGDAGGAGDAAWHTTAIDLAAGGGARRFADTRGGAAGAAGATATTGALDAAGASFAVTYVGATTGINGTGPAGTDARP